MNKRTSYHPFAKFLHWTIVVLIAIQFVSGEFMSPLQGSGIPNYFKIAHISFGLFVIPFAVMLFYMRFASPVARPETEEAVGMIKWVTIGTHYLLYVLLILLPLSGLAAASLRHMRINFFGLFNFPLTQTSNPSFVHILGSIHGGLATLIGLVSLAHIGAALYHHFVLKDSVLNRMRPGGQV